MQYVMADNHLTSKGRTMRTTNHKLPKARKVSFISRLAASAAAKSAAYVVSRREWLWK